MSILDFRVENVGEAGQTPKFIYLNTNDTIATVTATGYLNKLVAQNIPISELDMALVATKTSPGATSSQLSLFDVSKSGDNWSLTPSSSTLFLGNGQIFVGNPSGIAAAVTMSGDATISNTGVITIENNAITTAKIDDAAVTVAKLEADLQPSHVVKFAGQHTTAGGAAAEAITVTGAAATDLAFVQLVDPGTNTVSVVQAQVAADTLTVTFSANPGNDAIINYQLLRAV